MKGFKGEKGKLKVKICYYSKPLIKIENESREVFAEIPFIDNYVHLYGYEMANAQLISCAPELLDFISRISGEMLRNDFVLDEKWYDQAQQIIEKATTI